MAAVCKFLSFASSARAINQYCVGLCYHWLWTRYAYLATGLRLDRVFCVLEAKDGKKVWACLFSSRPRFATFPMQCQIWENLVC